MTDSHATADSAPLPPCDDWPAYFTVAQVAYVLDLSLQRVLALVKCKALRGEKLGGTLYIRTDQVRDLHRARRLRCAA